LQCIYNIVAMMPQASVLYGNRHKSRVLSVIKNLPTFSLSLSPLKRHHVFKVSENCLRERQIEEKQMYTSRQSMTV